MKPKSKLSIIYALYLLHFIFTGCIGGGEDVSFLDGAEVKGLGDIPAPSNEFCQDGYSLTPDGCKMIICGPGEIYNDSCAGDDPFSVAEISATCNEYGTDVIVGECNNLCADGYTLLENRCTEVICESGLKRVVPCETGISGGIGTKELSCNGSGTEWEHGTCLFSGCEDGFVDINGSCIEKVCNPGDRSIVSKECLLDGGAIGTTSDICNEFGTAYDQAGKCEFDRCKTGFVNDGGICLAVICEAGSKGVEQTCNYSDVAGVLGKTFPLCNANGTGYDSATSCEFAGCLTGFVQEEKSCIPVICKEGDRSSEYTECDLGKPGVIGKVANLCNANGTAYDRPGECVFDKCLAGFDQDGELCNPILCEPGTVGNKVSCELHIEGTLGESTELCNNSGTGYDPGECEFIGCSPQYINIAGKCEQLICEAGIGNGEFTVCELGDGIVGKKPVICNASGTAYDAASECIFDKCAEGFVNVGDNQCLNKLCNPGTIAAGSAEGCELEDDGAIGIKSLVCNDLGTEYSFGECEFSKCDSGFTLNEGSCKASCGDTIHGENDNPIIVFKSESPEFGAACEQLQQDRVCNDGVWSNLTNSEYTALTCREKECLPGSIKAEACDIGYVVGNEITSRNVVCSDSGVYEVGECLVVGCSDDYILNNNICEAPVEYQDVVDNFTQVASTTAKKLDVIWIIDNSGSMHDNQQHVKANVKTFADGLLGSDNAIDMRMAITTTDVTKKVGCGYDWYSEEDYNCFAAKRGRFIGDYITINSDMDLATKTDRVNKFKSQVDLLGTNGSGDEQGLMAMALSMGNEEFFRDDALLIYIIVSDEDEHSASSAEMYKEGLIANGKGATKIYSIVHKDYRVVTLKKKEIVAEIKRKLAKKNLTFYRKSNLGLNLRYWLRKFGERNSITYYECFSGWSCGVKYIEASKLTNGESYEISEPFANHLVEIGESVITLLSSFPLSQIPNDLEKLQVLIGGVDAKSAGFEWEYDEVNNAIKFTGSRLEDLPREGDLITVTYDIKK